MDKNLADHQPFVHRYFTPEKLRFRYYLFLVGFIIIFFLFSVLNYTVI